jgi:hypothetical protein
MQKGKAFMLYTNTKKIARKGRLVTESRKKNATVHNVANLKQNFLK